MALIAATSASIRSSGAQIKKASCTGAQTSIPRSVAKQAASRIISAPLACIGKFIIERAFGFEPGRTRLLDALEPHLRRALLRCAGCAGLTPRESDVAALVARGCTDRDIARILGIGFGTVRTHITNAMSKTGCSNRAELAAAIARRS
jgi:DNA-binding CsgD family transcriptional regulator